MNENDINEEFKALLSDNENSWMWIILIFVLAALYNENTSKDKVIAEEKAHQIMQEECKNKGKEYTGKERKKVSDLINRLFVRYCNA